MHVLRSITCGQVRWISNSSQILNRFTRDGLRQRLQKQAFKDAQKQIEQSHVNTLHPGFADTIPVRPLNHLWKALGFTAVVGVGSYTIAIISDIERVKRVARQLSPDAFFKDMFKSINHQQEELTWKDLSHGERTAATLILLNIAVFVLWKVKKIEPAMWRYFSNSYASKSLCSPMVLSAFSHNNLIHLGLNMYVLFSFASPAIDKFLGPDQFWAFYCTAAAVSSWTSLAHKGVVRSPVRALGASGAILALLGYVCMKMPDAKLSIIFIPQFQFSAENAIWGILAFDTIGLLLRFRLFDHAAHLGGTLFGVFYALYGEKLIWGDLGGVVESIYSSVSK